MESHRPLIVGGALDPRTPMGVLVRFRPGVSGSAGCNLFEASYEWNNPDLSWSDIEYSTPESTGEPHPCPEYALPVVQLMQAAIQNGVMS